MTKQEVKQGYYDSTSRFTNIDGDKFGACMKQIFDITNDAVIEWRIRKQDNQLCLIQFYEKGNGYQIYEQETDKQGIALTVAVITQNSFEEIRKIYHNGTMHAYEKIGELASKFEEEFTHVDRWEEFLDDPKNTGGHSYSDWEEFVADWSKLEAIRDYSVSRIELKATK